MKANKLSSWYRNIYIAYDTLLFHMIQKSSTTRVLEVFFKEPTTIHFIREISRKIKLAPTSVKNIINELEGEGIIKQKESKPFDGYIANRDNEEFLFVKKNYNLYSLYELKKTIEESVHPNATVLFGSYSRGEDIETSDIDILILSKIKKQINIENIEKILSRKINIMIIDSLDKLDKNIREKIYNGIILSGEI